MKPNSNVLWRGVLELRSAAKFKFVEISLRETELEMGVEQLLVLEVVSAVANVNRIRRTSLLPVEISSILQRFPGGGVFRGQYCKKMNRISCLESYQNTLENPNETPVTFSRYFFLNRSWGIYLTCPKQESCEISQIFLAQSLAGYFDQIPR